MARIETDPNYTAPTFSRATAATDLFKKEDVQGLAAAVSTHDHSSGKGLVLASSAIPSGLITSAMIANGTIATVDLAANAVQGTTAVYSGTPTWSTSVVATWVDTPLILTGVSCSGERTVRVEGQTMVSNPTVGANFLLGLATDSTGQATFAQIGQAVGGVPVSWTMYLTPTAGTHNFSLQIYQYGAGTVSINAASTSYLYVTDEKR